MNIWEKDADKPSFDKLKTDCKTDVLIIGAGIAGLNLAYLLKLNGVECVVAESDESACGTTLDTTAKITAGHGLIYANMIKTSGLDTAKKYFNANMQAIDDYRKICENIDCDFETKPAYVYTLRDKEMIELEAKAIKQCGGNALYTNELDIPLKIKCAVGLDAQAQFNPIKYLYHIAKGLKIYEHTRVLEIRGSTAICEGGCIYAKRIVVATHFPFMNKYGGYFLKMYQQRSYILVLKNAGALKGMYIDEKSGGLSFRGYKDMLLLGGESGRTGCTDGAFDRLKEKLNKYYPRAEIIHHAATQDCMTLDGIPYIGRYSDAFDYIYVMTGFNKWGMTSSMAAANIIKDMLVKNKNEYADIFSPQRSILHKHLFKNIGSTVMNFCKIAPRCPHLGCALKFNSSEHSWDCPCHGSRFDLQGGRLNGPATEDKNMK